MYARPRVDGEVTTLGVSGKLWRDSLIMYDRATRSLWSQVAGEAVAGPLQGHKLEELPSELTTWGDWRARHPDTLVLVKPPRQGSVYDDYHRDRDKIGVGGSRNPDRRLPGKTLVYGLKDGEATAAVPFPIFEAARAFNGHAFGRPIVVFSPPGGNAAAAYDRRAADRVLTFEPSPAAGDRLAVRDLETGSRWSWEEGLAIEGPLAGRRLERIPGTAVYWGIWARFHPETELLDGSNAGIGPPAKAKPSLPP